MANKIKVGLDISQLAHRGGVATYTKNLSQKLALQKSLQMTYFYSSLRVPYDGPLPHVKPFPFPPILFEKLFNHLRVVPIERFIGKVDIYHSSDWIQPKTKAKKVTTYHDLVPLKFPEWSHSKIIKVHKSRLKLVEREIDIVIAVSESTKNDLIEVSNIPKEKIRVIYEGVREEFRPQLDEDVAEFKKKHGLPDKFILAIGGVGSRRNLERVKEASVGYNLVITGHNLTGVEDEEMPLLYSAADVLLYPSLYEGFGLPVLEAMATGTPVITSNSSSLPEVGGEAALLINPTDVTEITKAVQAVIEDDDRCKSMIKQGFIQAKKFSWEKCASETVGIYKELINENRY
ncbi:hypothetical protein A3C32_04170 [Candidatus Daviesbacteria bacterium RIFCSPHIGHO2_02_FULL_41_14]|uniref:Glycosyl transferase family 1 domain-containing protein n=1 Tax=Candidatus Daviesbacteria bacterium RIFCSPLOWO2_01_FULL_40_24 TaxID=1797787 RepID=A0A1F5MJ88_9BACT|nr:MAG: hypothetical protein A3C32_04170 [Candidatus Daviesbacteria bacterium RIFCSPHIGHO2_02_FULL_41_14]OGE65422.1 MAG: hypothetical protein A3B49_00865 [Candidatus Daviesbacteria bacterium RIFCSPLOWO2_01_FULL_40_24]OGH82009.1 MAG: hypothetical protein A3F93_04275 [Candidatus Magasanikbacteria bacterium RIFCSPLOWO2_12_FULL_34_7]